MARIDAFLKLGAAQGCSDVHLAVGVPPMLRMNGELMPIKFRNLADAELESYVTEIMSSSQTEQFARGHDIDFSYVSTDDARFRVNVFRKDTGVGAVFRTIPNEVPTIDSLNLPAVVTRFCDYHQGMVLVTGSTGTGKSTTLAAMIDHLNRDAAAQHHHPRGPDRVRPPQQDAHRSSSASSAPHTASFAEGVRAAMREDPDVILVGELRDPDTVRWAMTAAETGHLVLGTLHTTSAVKTIDRMVDALPAEEREQTKSFLSQSLIGVVTQVLVRTPDLRGRRAVCEVMVMNRAIGKLIMTDQSHMIPSQLQTGKELAMQTMDQALLGAIQAREIDPEDAFVYAQDKRLFTRYVADGTAILKADGTQGVT